MQANSLSKTNLISFLKETSRLKDDLDSFKSVFGHRVTNYNEFGTIWLEPINPVFASIAISLESNRIYQVSFQGDFKFTQQDLISFFGIPREVYAFRDDRFEYFYDNLGEDLVPLRIMVWKNYSKIETAHLTEHISGITLFW